VDIIAEYATELAAGGLLNLQAALNITQTELDGAVRVPDSLVDSPGAAETLYSRQEITWLEDGQPQHHLVLAGTYARGPLSVTLRANEFAEVTSTESPSSSCEADRSCLDQTFGAKWLVDVEASWNFTDALKVTIGADNVFDETPDRQVPATDFNGIFPYSRRTTPFGFNGGYYYASVNYSFAHGL
jgi:iron complex outermembrane receptor protein